MNAWRDIGRDITPEMRENLPFCSEAILERAVHEVVIEGRTYEYVLYPGRRTDTCVHFSAFFGEWGDRSENRSQYQGHFHRLRMFWPIAEFGFIFVCDTSGADGNGSYYKGEAMDFFVERAFDQIFDTALPEASSVVGIGSSMGATGALRFALRRGWLGAIAVTPNIDLDISAVLQGRRRHVAEILGHEDVQDKTAYGVTREIRELAATVPPTTHIVIQSICDDDGVHQEQVLPFVSQWAERGGTIRLDERSTGGHTSEYATQDWFARQIDWCFDGSQRRSQAAHGRPDGLS